MVLDARLVENQKAKAAQKAKEAKTEVKSAAPKSDQYGDIRKCPACGSIVGAFKGICPECGYEFANVDVNLSSQKLYDTLTKAKFDKQKVEIIETFPVPNAKADLLEFLTALKPRIIDTNSNLQNAYFKKYSECIEKAKVSFAGDKQLQLFVDGYEDLVKQLRKKTISILNNLFQWVLEHWIISIVIIILVIGGISEWIEDIKAEHVKNKLVREMPVFESYINDGEADKAKSLLAAASVKDYDAAYKLFQLYVSRDDVANAMDVYDNLIPGDKSSAKTSLINLLIKSGDYDTAWLYYSKTDNDSPTYAGNAQSYYQFMTDVVTYLCKEKEKDKAAAQKFIKEYSIWFDKYVNNGEWGKNYMDYSYARAKAKLLQLLNRL